MRNVLCDVHKKNGTTGLVPRIYSHWFKNAHYDSALYLGHDLLAHTQNEDGSIEHELRALGAEIWLTDFWKLARMYNPVWSDIAIHVNRYLNDNEADLKPTPSYSLSLKERQKVNSLVDFYQLRLNIVYNKSWVDQNRNLILEWLYYGLSRARRRYRQQSLEVISNLRQTINAECRELELKTGESYMLSYNLKGFFKIRKVKELV